jgi:hypothetical protein
LKKKVVIEVIIDCPHMNENGECEEFSEKVVFCPKRNCTRTTSLADLLACVRGNLAPDEAKVLLAWHSFLEGELDE